MFYVQNVRSGNSRIAIEKRIAHAPKQGRRLQKSPWYHPDCGFNAFETAAFLRVNAALRPALHWGLKGGMRREEKQGSCTGTIPSLQLSARHWPYHSHYHDHLLYQYSARSPSCQLSAADFACSCSSFSCCSRIRARVSSLCSQKRPSHTCAKIAAELTLGSGVPSCNTTMVYSGSAAG